MACVKYMLPKNLRPYELFRISVESIDARHSIIWGTPAVFHVEATPAPVSCIGRTTMTKETFERCLVTTSGIGLIWIGMRTRFLSGLLVAAGGSALAAAGLRGSSVRQLLGRTGERGESAEQAHPLGGINRNAPPDRGTTGFRAEFPSETRQADAFDSEAVYYDPDMYAPARDRVDESIDESFPASDPPARGTST